jgi:hypothetical protein
MSSKDDYIRSLLEMLQETQEGYLAECVIKTGQNDRS